MNKGKTGKKSPLRLPAEVQGMLQPMEPAAIRKRLNRSQEHDLKHMCDAFSPDKTLICLFAGACRTDKSVAAAMLAKELDLDLYRIDLAAVVSKYIGETEKNLERIFDAAAEGGWILFFDEAGALFGKRSEVKDSHDRYANIEISYLLQRMEHHGSPIILAISTKLNLDPAFVRRLRYVIDFPDA